MTQEKMTFDVDVVGAYWNAFANLVAWYASFGGQLDGKGLPVFVESGTITLTMSAASIVRDDAFRQAVLKAGAEYLSRMADKTAQESTTAIAA